MIQPWDLAISCLAWTCRNAVGPNAGEPDHVWHSRREQNPEIQAQSGSTTTNLIIFNALNVIQYVIQYQ
jgi:hypothetical protein